MSQTKESANKASQGVPYRVAHPKDAKSHSRANPAKLMQGGPRRGPGATGGRVKLQADTVPTLKRLFAYIGHGYLPYFVLALVCMVVVALISVRASLFLKTLIDDNIKPLLLMGTPDYSGLKKAILTMAGLYAIAVVASFSRSMFMRVVSQGVIREIRTDLFNHLQTLPISYFDTHPYGDVMSRFTNDTDSMRQVISQSLPQVLSSLVTIVSVFTAMVRLSWRLTIVVLICVVGIYFITITIGGRSALFFKARQSALGEVNAFIEEMMNGQKVVKVFCHEDEAMEEFNYLNSDLRQKTTKANSYAMVLGPIMMNLSNVQYVIVAVIGGWMAINGIGHLTLGSIVSFLTLSRNFSQPVSQISQQINSVVMALAGATRVFKVMDEAPELDEGTITMVFVNKAEDGTLTESPVRTGHWAWKIPEGDVDAVIEEKARDYIQKKDGYYLQELRGDVRLHDVDFSYTPEKQILYDINLYAKPGQKIAFVGSTGAGKTTITNLITRFYDIQKGQISYDGLDIMRIKKYDLRLSLGIVLQDVNLFTGTIADNIRYGRADITDEEVRAAAKLANADSFIELLPEGYDTVISGTGSQLSQGQCQLLSIARCAAADPPVMILDEATSSVDTRTEALIQQGMDSLMHGRTTFVIAHRLSTVQNANAIMVLESGRIIERGDHDDLIAQQGRYYQLYTGNSAKAAK